jgi:hypothetical protein
MASHTSMTRSSKRHTESSIQQETIQQPMEASEGSPPSSTADPPPLTKSETQDKASVSTIETLQDIWTEPPRTKVTSSEGNKTRREQKGIAIKGASQQHRITGSPPTFSEGSPPSSTTDPPPLTNSETQDKVSVSTTEILQEIWAAPPRTKVASRAGNKTRRKQKGVATKGALKQRRSTGSPPKRVRS